MKQMVNLFAEMKCIERYIETQLETEVIPQG